MQARVVPIAPQRAQRLVTFKLAAILIGHGNLATRAGLHQLQPYALAAQLIDAVLVVGLQARQHDIRPKTIHRQPHREPVVEVGERRGV